MYAHYLLCNALVVLLLLSQKERELLLLHLHLNLGLHLLSKSLLLHRLLSLRHLVLLERRLHLLSL